MYTIKEIGIKLEKKIQTLDQFCTQNPWALWSAHGWQVRLWGKEKKPWFDWLFTNNHKRV